MPSYFIKWVIIHYFHYWFWCSNCPQFYRWQPLQPLLWCFEVSPEFFEHISTSWHKNVFQAHLILSLQPPHGDLLHPALASTSCAGPPFWPETLLNRLAWTPPQTACHINILFTIPRTWMSWATSLSLSPTPRHLLHGYLHALLRSYISFWRVHPAHLLKLQYLSPNFPPMRFPYWFWSGSNTLFQATLLRGHPPPPQLVSTHCDTWGFPLLPPRT